MGPRISEVWQYVRDGKCTLCPEMKISTKKSSNILRHIRRAHSEVYQQIMTNRYAPPMHNKRTDFTMVQQAEMVHPSEISMQDDLEHNDHDADLSHTIDQLFGTSSMGAIFGDSCVKDDSSQLVADLMRQFYDLGWVFGSGGAMCIRVDNYTYVTPTSIQKDRLRPEDIGVYNQNELVVQPKGGSVSSCINLFWTIFRTNEKQFPTRSLNSVIHTHSLEANLMASFPIGSHYDQVHLGNEEMLKGIVDRAGGAAYSNTQTLIIPVIENAPSEGSPEFKERIENAMVRYPSCSAILVRNHGAFYFGSSWEETKIMAEIFEYLFKLTLEKLKFAPRLCEQIFFTTATS
ncbi:putative methylthioribulose-1-phosphate dehydratase [Aphelenchoides bicaudatus]|nr:putative methylthioribulose-1-phosphate dehydratase [Aphelenchoides bicaudatus]